MKVLLLEDNLLWSVRTRRGLETIGCKVVVSPKGEVQECDLAVVNLGARAFDAFKAIEALKKSGVRTIGHAGHKEKELLEKGKKAGCDEVVSNSTLAHKLPSLVE